MLKIKLNLSQLTHAIRPGKAEGEQIIYLPIKQNQLFISDKGNVYLDLVGFHFTDKSEAGNTHVIKQSFPKEYMEKLTEEQKKALPIIGNAKYTPGTKPADTKPEQTQPTGGNAQHGADDLPF